MKARLTTDRHKKLGLRSLGQDEGWALHGGFVPCWPKLIRSLRVTKQSPIMKMATSSRGNPTLHHWRTHGHTASGFAVLTATKHGLVTSILFLRCAGFVITFPPIIELLTRTNNDLVFSPENGSVPCTTPRAGRLYGLFIVAGIH